MTGPAYYNEFDKNAAQWLRNLMAAGHITPGVVDERSIEDVTPNDLIGFTRVHFFAGIGVWDHALNLAGWGDTPVWTGSCPCQPFSAAGEGKGFADERHLWPAFLHLIEQCRPAIVLGEQVASKDANAWLDLVQDDLEGMGYRVGAVAFPSAGVGAPHIRDRLYWVADAGSERRERREGAAHRRLGHGDDAGRLQGDDGTAGPGEAGVWLADTEHHGRDRQAGSAPVADSNESRQWLFDGDSAVGGLANPGDSARQPGEPRAIERGLPQGACEDAAVRPGPTNGFWRDADWLGCRDGKWRPVEPGTFPLAHGAASRVVRLRAYGNAICAKAAQAFIESVMESSE